MVEQEWTSIPGFPNYAISRSGEVLNVKRNRQIAKSFDKDGYLLVNLWKDNKQHTCKLSRLVATVFIPNPDGLPEVNHKDEDKTNNCVDNLEWCDRKHNINYGTRTEKTRRKLGTAVVATDKDGNQLVFPSLTYAAQTMGVSRGRIRRAIDDNKLLFECKWGYANVSDT